MDHFHRSLIRSRQVDLLDAIVKGHCLGTLVDHLVQQGIFWDGHLNDILKAGVQTTDIEKARKFLDILCTSGPDAFDAFKRTIIDSNNRGLAHILKIQLSEDQNAAALAGAYDTHQVLITIQHSLRETYLERFRKVIPLSLPFAFDIADKWVPLTLKLEDNSASTDDHANLLNKAFAKVKMLIIEGDPATGKTSLLRRLAYEWTQKKPQLSHYDLVVYAEFREVWEQEFGSISQLISYYVQSRLDKQDYEKFVHFIADIKCCKEHQILVLLDGYDESFSDLKKKKQCEELSDYLFSSTIRKPLRFDVVLTSRRGYLSKLRKQEGRFIFAELLGFTNELQKQEYISKHIESSINILSVQNLLEKNKNLQRLSETPLMLTFICLLHGRINDGTEVELYMNIVWWLLDRHQKDNPTHDVPSLFGYQNNECDKFRVIQDYYPHFSQLHLLGKMAMLDIFKTTFTKKDLDQFKLNPIVGQVGLLRKEEKRDLSHKITTEFSFPHRTVQEFIIAFTFCFSSEEPPENFCWFTFDKGRKIGGGIIQQNIYSFLRMIISSQIVFDVSRKLFFSKMEERMRKNKCFIYHRADLTTTIYKKTYSNFRLISDKGLSIPQSEEATKLLLHDVEQGHATSQYILGFMYKNGLGFPQSDEEAVKWFSKAAEQGDANGQNSLGFMYDEGRGVSQSDEEAVKWFRKAAEQGNADAQYSLGLMYLNGQSVPQSDEEAVKWYRKAAEQGDANGQNNLGLMYRNGQSVPQSDEEAVKWYRKAAEQGDASGQNNLGLMYDIGRGVPQSDEEAVKWYRKAAEQGHEGGQNNLGLMYRNGRGVPQSDEEAVKWYRKAAEQGDASGQNNLGFMYDIGRGVPQSDEEAVKWYRKAAEQGDANGQNNLGLMYRNGQSVPQSDEEAVKWFRKAAEQVHARGQNNLGFMYQNGRGVSQSDEEAVKWLRKAAEQRDASGQYNLGFMYQNGRGVPQSDEEAVKWYRKAAEQGDATCNSVVSVNSVR